MSKVIIVTGSNKGIGFATVRTLAQHFTAKENHSVYLTARNVDLGQQAVKDLAAQNVEGVKFHQLDIDNQSSIDTFAAYIKEKYGGVDVFVHNAAIAYKAASTAPFSEQAEVTTRVNYTGSVNVWNAFSPLLKSGARWVNVSSRAGMLKVCKDATLRDRLTSPTSSIADITRVMDTFVAAAKEGKNESISTSAYGMSKVGLTALTRVQQRLVNDKSDIAVNALCPGYVDTDMSSHKGHLTIEQGSETPVYLAELPANTQIRGKFLAEKKEMNWEDLNWTWQ